MDKSKFFAGQPIFSQLLKFIPADLIQGLARENDSDRYYKRFKAYDHLVTMLYTCLHGCRSLREVTTGMLASVNQLSHLRIFNIPRRSTLSDANRSRKESFFAAVYHRLYNLHYGHLPDSRKGRTLEKRLFILDSTTIKLFSDVMKGMGDKPMNGKRKGGAKAHVVLSAQDDLPRFVALTDGTKNDKIMTGKFTLPSGSILVFDKAYNSHTQLDKWSQQKITWVTRVSEVASYERLEDIPVSNHVSQMGVLSDQIIILGRKSNKKTPKITVRLIIYFDEETNKIFGFLTNNFDFSPLTIADLYRKRWQIELLFKRIKQHYPLRYFLGDNENAIKIQIWCALISDLLVKIVKDKLKRKWSYSNIASMVRLHLMHYIHLLNFLNEPDKFVLIGPSTNNQQLRLIT